LLRSRCYDCGNPIAARYPLVELTGGLLFVGLAAVELWPPVVKAASEPAFMPHATGGEIVARYVYHLWLLATLLAAALIDRDSHIVPRKMLLLAIGVGLAGAIAWPAVQPLFGQVLPATWHLELRWSALAASLAGGLAGWMGGQLFSLIGSPSSKNLAALESRSKQVSLPDPILLTCAGVFLGWQAAVLIGLAATLFWLTIEGWKRRRPNTARWGWTAFVFVAAIGWIALSRNWYDRPARWNAEVSPLGQMLERK
jgi:prepilin signal peptidase PulO-like enzyme (type II secretory pathway)